MKQIILIFLFLSYQTHANEIPSHAVGLKEVLVSTTTEDNKIQQGVLSLKINSNQPTYLAVLLPGYPSVVIPEMKNDIMYNAKLIGNFLIRSRSHLVDMEIASLIVDCKPHITNICQSSYQSSIERHQDVSKLIIEIKKRYSSIREVWLVGTSMGTISSSFMPTYDDNFYTGSIHTATITVAGGGSFGELRNFDYKKTKIPQFFIHHKDDPCDKTTYAKVKDITDKFNLPLVTVFGGSDFKGNPCAAFSQHGFRGKEEEVMNTIKEIIKTKKLNKYEIN